ncbi:glucan-binding repeat-containing protein [Clostridium saccharoperbutylacetonicum]|uniref:Glycoside hydrolase family 25 n=2 Tax=Clostridium TaxID=1485 RepID=M1MIP5_9CLOT|nr:GH25 family lysozyme [Clostridium saccharoperbutylacetonicum]AGF56198.1 glycoside hydrolase family 25 [Clostridium saccharoperbutylacetonicum N1-4(HMT)]NRT63060.1 glucan-binding repeat-containing protein [Clostridium saccharoperbutylacetonicum]NSB26417.1 glucan-binding repeat-containing protein [Clostridium saccharoperbutylacetonicum]NSB45770.1 glucan-binding repeat-containing protein [Clostridium saccharoperbutylacetonicum]
MNIKKKFVTLVLTFAMILSFIPTLNVQAATTDYKLISESEVTSKEAKNWAKSKGASSDFLKLADLYFKYSSDHGDVNPAIAYVQAAVETGYGNFGGVLDSSYYNPCGLKKSSGSGTDKDTYQKFDSWDEGVQAHLDHLALLAGVKGYPRDSSYDEKQSSSLKGKAIKISDLSGIWATNTSYGDQIINLYKDLINSTKDNTNTDSKDNSSPNPGKPETIPNSPNITTVVGINNSPVNITSTIGWRQIYGSWYYYTSDKNKAKGWIKPDNYWYYLQDDGTMATGWIQLSGTWYYLDDSGAMIIGWRYLGGCWYYLQGDGSMVTGLRKIDGNNYLFDPSGEMLKGWKLLDNHWYYFNSDGSMATGWIKDNNLSYYLYETGAMAKGWITINGVWYYFKDNGSMQKGWFTASNGDLYYLDMSTGKMLTNTTVDPYIIGTDGKAIKKSTSDTNNSSSNSKTDTTPSNTNASTNSNLIYAIDISNHDGNIDFSKVKYSGTKYVYIKATEGTTFVDPYLSTYYTNAQNVGIKTGFYHFLVGTSAPETQAQNFYNNIKNKKSDLKPCLDIETSGFNVSDYAVRFINEFKRISNMNICIYTYSNFISNLDGRLSSYPLWEANYNNTAFKNLPSNSIWTSRIGHQFTDSGKINGINANVDLDAFTQDILN